MSERGDRCPRCPICDSDNFDVLLPKCWELARLNLKHPWHDAAAGEATGDAVESAGSPQAGNNDRQKEPIGPSPSESLEEQIEKAMPSGPCEHQSAFYAYGVCRRCAVSVAAGMVRQAREVADAYGEAGDEWMKRAEAAESRLAAIIGAHEGKMGSCAARIEAAEKERDDERIISKANGDALRIVAAQLHEARKLHDRHCQFSAHNSPVQCVPPWRQKCAPEAKP